MRLNIVGPFRVNAPFATEIAFAKGLRARGHDVIEFDPNVDHPDLLDRTADFTLVFKTALDHNRHLVSMPNVVLYQPDDLRFPHIRAMVSEMRRYSDHLITFRELTEQSDRDVLYFLAEQGFSSLSHLPVTADPDIYYPEDIERDIQFCFVGSLGDPACHWQRHRMVELLRSRGHQVMFGQTNDVNEIRRIYCRSRVVINHASDSQLPFGLGFGYQCRHFEVAMTRSVLLSNDVLHDTDPPLIQNFCRFSNEEEFLDRAERLLDYVYADDAAAALYNEVMSEHSPYVRAGQLVSILESL